MNTLTKFTLVLIPIITLSMSATAHDPKFHKKTPEKADCSKIDFSKMDMKDPVTIAMMKKCLKQAEKSKGNTDHSKVKKLEDKNMKKEGHDNH